MHAHVGARPGLPNLLGFCRLTGLWGYFEHQVAYRRLVYGAKVVIDGVPGALPHRGSRRLMGFSLGLSAGRRPVRQ